MGAEHERAVEAFVAEGEGTRDAPKVEALLSHFAIDARCHIYAWEEPLVRHDALRDEFLREAPVMVPELILCVERRGLTTGDCVNSQPARQSCRTGTIRKAS